MNPKVIVIVGQTSTGKSDLAVKMAKRFDGEVVIADSRQVYRGVDLGSGKITKEEMKSVPHHLLDIADPRKNFSVYEFKKLAEKKIKEIIKRNKVPIITGGTGFYIDAITKGMILPNVPPNPRLRRGLEGKSTEGLTLRLKRIDPERAKNIDLKNRVRLIRAIEIAEYLGKVPKLKTSPAKYEFVKIGLLFPERILKKRIKTRLRERLRKGMALELHALHEKGIPWKRFEELGFDQKYTALYLQGKLTEVELLEKLLQANWRYAKSQMTWFKRDGEIRWFRPHQFPQIGSYVKEMLLSA